jgi:Flp pilus assembly secretin CpaC
MRYLSLLAAMLASTPVCAAELTDTIKLRPGFALQWQAPGPFKAIALGNPDVVDVRPGQTDKEIVITMKPDGGTTNIILTDKDGNQVANLRVTNPGPQYQIVQSAETGAWQVYRNDDSCHPDCDRNDAPVKPTNKAQPKTVAN